MTPTPVVNAAAMRTLRTLAQLVVGYAVSHLALAQLPAGVDDWLVEFLATVVFVAVVTWVTAKLEALKGEDPVARIGRAIGAILMLGLSGSQPVYVAPNTNHTADLVRYADGISLTPLRQ